MLTDVYCYIDSCTDCAQAKVQHTLPVGKLMLLPTPQHPWSHLSLDFFNDLSKYQGNTIILVIIDKFSCFLWLIPHSFWNSKDHFQPCVLVFWYPRAYSEWSGSAIHIKGLDELHEEIESLCEPHFQLSSQGELTPSATPLLISLHPNAWVSNLHCSPGIPIPLIPPQWKTGTEGVSEYGRTHTKCG